MFEFGWPTSGCLVKIQDPRARAFGQRSSQVIIGSVILCLSLPPSLEGDYCGLSLEINSHDVSVKEVKCECAYYGRYKKVAGLRCWTGQTYSLTYRACRCVDRRGIIQRRRRIPTKSSQVCNWMVLSYWVYPFFLIFFFAGMAVTQRIIERKGKN